jgi:ketosteroid isomerase-like protein
MFKKHFETIKNYLSWLLKDTIIPYFLKLAGNIVRMSLILLSIAPACNLASTNSYNTIDLQPGDRSKITQVINDYREAWLINDSAKILNLFADTATLIPSGLQPITGKASIREFWWPNDSSTTTINDYDIRLLEINGTGNLAYTFENGHLSWSYEKGTIKLSKEQSSYEITIFSRDNNGVWKIIKRIWTDMK